MSRLLASPLPRLALRGAGCLVFTVSAMGAGCPGDDPEGSTGDYGTDSSFESSGDPSTTTPSTSEPSTTTPSTTEPSTTTPSTTTPSTSDPATTDPSTDTTPADTTDTDPTGTASNCLPPGTFILRLTGTTDLYGHFPYLKLFYAPDAPEETVDEVLEFDVAPDGTVSFHVPPREPDGFEGHEVLPNLEGTMDEDCNVLVDGTVEYVGGGSPYGSVTVNVEGIFGNVETDGEATGSITLEGGNIPEGPIVYNVEVAPQ